MLAHDDLTADNVDDTAGLTIGGSNPLSGTAIGSAHSGLRQARMIAQQHMRDRIDQGAMWDERAVTELLLVGAYNNGGFRYAEFTQRAEADVGADWIWWFIDRSDECFGILIQAKSLKMTNDVGTRFQIDYNYAQSRQLERLYESAETLNIPAAYALYCGDPAYRKNLPCRRRCVRPEHCELCEQKSVSVVPALIAANSIAHGKHSSAVQSFQDAEPLENLGLPSANAREALVFGLRLVEEPELKEFLSQPQRGARAIAKSILVQILRVRCGHFGAATREGVEVGQDAIFRDCSLDRGHFGLPYMPHVLRGLLARPPAYVVDFLRHGAVADEMAGLAAGLVVVQV